MAGSLAIDGGTPVRDVRANPWPAWPRVSDEEWAEVKAAFRDVYRSGNEGLPWRKSLEVAARFATWCGTRHALLFPSGTTSLMGAIIGTVDPDPFARAEREIIIPNYTFSATANAVLHLGFRCVFADIDPQTFVLTPESLERAVSPSTAAAIPVHLGGQAVDADGIERVARAAGIRLIGDSAQAHGAAYRGRNVGSLFDASCFSFQSTKNITTGEGGMLATDDDEVFARAHAYMNAGRLPGKERWAYYSLGYNFRPSEYVAALLGVRLRRVDDETRIRNESARRLSEALSTIPGIAPPAIAPWTTTHGFHLYMALYDTEAFGGRSREDFVAALTAEGVPAMAGYERPLSEYPAYRELRAKHPEMFRVEASPNAERACARSVWFAQQMLLDGPGMDAIAEAIEKIRRAWS
ncbi:MAG: DegT/DnrJ/EryC1/StrS family aminotransferase [Planctomycetes bacterium]|nr:DegT/DnrJ/EryC1/StrS family aminotransferase [Planctomycetota bacterium]